MGHIWDPGKGKVKYAYVRLHRGGKTYSVSTGSKNVNQANRFLDRVEILIERRLQGDPPPVELHQWITNLPDNIAARLSNIGLLDPRIRASSKSLHDTKDADGVTVRGHISEWGDAVKARRANTVEHAEKYVACVRNIAAWLNWETYDEPRPGGDADDHRVSVSSIEVELDKRGLAPATRIRYLLAAEDFCSWMVHEKRAATRLIKDAAKPRPVPEWDRRPFEVNEIVTLFDFLDTLYRYPKQAPRALWNGYDRKLLYWTAIKTGFRKSELESLRRHQLHLNDQLSFIRLPGRDAKNDKPFDMPIPPDLAQALRDYTSEMGGNDRVFWISSGKDRWKEYKSRPGEFYRSYGGAAGTLRRDVTAAGLGHILETDQHVDFHALRSTAITWWLEEDKRSPRQVMHLARLSSLDMVQKYVRGARLDDHHWLQQSTIPSGQQDIAPINHAFPA